MWGAMAPSVAPGHTLRNGLASVQKVVHEQLGINSYVQLGRRDVFDSSAITVEPGDILT